MKLIQAVVVFFAFLNLGFTHIIQGTETRALPPFTEVSAGQGISVVLKPGPKPIAEISAGGSYMPNQVSTKVSGDRLRITLRNYNSRRQIEVVVYYQQLEGLYASSSAEIFAEDQITSDYFMLDVSSSGRIQANVRADDMQLDASSAGELEATLYAEKVFADASSGSSMELSGKVTRFVTDTSSSSDIHAFGVVAQEAVLEASSGSSQEITVVNRLEAEASSGASIRYKGDPVDRYIKGRSGGDIRRKSD